jgi:hypothetical protein
MAQLKKKKCVFYCEILYIDSIMTGMSCHIYVIVKLHRLACGFGLHSHLIHWFIAYY